MIRTTPHIERVPSKLIGISLCAAMLFVSPSKSLAEESTTLFACTLENAGFLKRVDDEFDPTLLSWYGPSVVTLKTGSCSELIPNPENLHWCGLDPETAQGILVRYPDDSVTILQKGLYINRLPVGGSYMLWNQSERITFDPPELRHLNLDGRLSESVFKCTKVPD